MESYQQEPELKTEQPEKKHEMIETIDKVIEISDVFLQVGQFVFKNAAQILGDIMGVGSIVKKLLDLIPEEKVPDGVLPKLEVLEKKIDMLADKMNSKFDDLKLFITEVNFYVEIMNPTSNLMKFMMDCLKHPDEEALENFKNAYKRHSPISLAYSLLSLLEQKSTNPLKMAMDNDELKTKTTFNKWESIIKGVLAEFLFLEAFADGLLKNRNKYSSKRIIERSEHLFNVMDDWKEDYKRTNTYWSDLPKNLKKVLEEYPGRTHPQKVNALKHFLENILTNDAHYIAVFNKLPADDADFHYVHKNSHPEKLIELYAGGSNAFVYRSQYANSVDEKRLVELSEEVEKVTLDTNFEIIPKSTWPR